MIIPPPTAATSWTIAAREGLDRISSRPNRCHRRAVALVFAPLHNNEVEKC